MFSALVVMGYKMFYAFFVSARFVKLYIFSPQIVQD